MVADPLSAIGVVGGDGKYISEVLDFVERGAELCAPLKAFDEVAGLTNGSLNFPKNIPVAVGTMDAWGNVYGSGLLDSSHAMEIGGTSEIVAILSNKSVPTPGIISFPAIRNRHLHAGPTQAGGDALAWFANLHSKTIEETLSAAKATDKSDSRVIFLPHLDGERAPHWNPNAQGVWIGMNRATTFGELARSVLEGVAFSARQIREGCENAGGARVTSIRVSGGAALSDYWNQIKANVHGLPIHVLDEIDTGARGIALVAGGAIGLTDDLEKWADSLITISRTINPEPKKVQELDYRYRIYKDTYLALEEIFERNRVK
jgi:xylulokinase